MATYYWVGATTSTDLSSSANWSSSRGGAGGAGTPTSGDTVYIETGSVDITAGSLTCDTVYYSAPVNLGASGSAITIAAAVAIHITGNREFMNIAGSGTCPLLTYRPTSGRLSLTAGTWTTTYCGTYGQCDVGASAVSTNLHSAGCIVTAAYNATGFTLLNITGGNADGIARSAATVYGGPGTVVRTTGAAAISTIAVIHGKLLHHSYGTIASIITGNGARATTEGGAYSCTVTASVAGANSYCFTDERNVTKSAPTVGLGATQ